MNKEVFKSTLAKITNRIESSKLFSSLLKIRASIAITIVFVLSLVPILGMGAYAAYSTRASEAATGSIEIGQKSIEHLLIIKGNTERLRSDAYKLLITKEASYIEEMRGILKENGSQLAEVKTHIDNGKLEIDKSHIDSLESGRAEMTAAIENLAVSYNGKGAEAAYNEIEALVGPEGKCTVSLNNIIKEAQKAIDKASIQHHSARSNMFTFNIIMIVISILVVFCSAVLANQVIFKNLKLSVGHVVNAAKKLSASSTALHTDSEEISKLAIQIAAAVSQIAHSTSEQAVSSANTAELVERIYISIAKLAEGARLQYENVNKAASQLSSLSTMIQQVSVSAQRVADVTNNTTEVASKGSNAVAETISGMDKIRETSLDSAAKVQTLGEKSKQIGEIIEVIDDIAEQTNL
ncbi:MAG: hypothetical protein K6T91_10885, partial [Firmicutes bacterium]|nr:hypothetical protein [Bacillota bacterium]